MTTSEKPKRRRKLKSTKHHQIVIRANEATRRHWKNVAKEMGLSLSELIRKGVERMEKGKGT